MSTAAILKKNSKLFLPVLSMSIFLSIWQVLHWIIGGEFLPSPYQVYLEAMRMFSIKIGGNSVWMHIYYSLRRVILAYLLGAATGLPLGMYMGWNRTFDKVVKPVFEVLRPIPPIAWIPIAILWFGIGEGPKIFICYVGAFVIFVLNSYTGMRYTAALQRGHPCQHALGVRGSSERAEHVVDVRAGGRAGGRPRRGGLPDHPGHGHVQAAHDHGWHDHHRHHRRFAGGYS
jgi:Binding-protein-dependent transport system inner membrane component